MSYRIAIADDEPLLRAHLRETLAQVWPNAEMIGEADNGDAALQLLQQAQPDLLFLDIKMPGLSGLDVAQKHSGHTHIVFVTAYDQYAIEAFEHGAIDYILKPVDPQRLQKTILRLKERQHQPPAAIENLLSTLAAQQPRKYMRWIQASAGNTIHFITIDDVQCFQAEDKYTKVVTAKLEAYIRKSIKELIDELNPEQFWQINRGIIIAVDQIEHARREPDGSLQVKLKQLATPLPVSQTWQTRFKQM